MLFLRSYQVFRTLLQHRHETRNHFVIHTFLNSWVCVQISRLSVVKNDADPSINIICQTGSCNKFKLFWPQKCRLRWICCFLVKPGAELHKDGWSAEGRITSGIRWPADTVSYEPLHRRRLSDAPHLHPWPLLLLAARTVGAVGGTAVERHHQADGRQNHNQQQNNRHQTDGQEKVRGQTRRGQLQGGEKEKWRLATDVADEMF